MSDVFLSYASEDRERARVLAASLESRGWSVWWDRKIVPGESFDDVIERELEGAKCVVVLWSESSVASDWVKSEASAAAERGVLIPALIDEVKIPLGFRRTQTADLCAFKGDLAHSGFQDLCSGIANASGLGASAHEVSLPTSPRSKKVGRTWLWPVGASVVGLVALGLGLYLTSRRSVPNTPAATILADARDAVGMLPKPVPSSEPTSSTASAGSAEKKTGPKPARPKTVVPPVPAPLVETSKDEHKIYVYPDCKPFSDSESETSKGPIVGIEVRHGAFIYGTQIHYKGAVGRQHGFVPTEADRKKYGISSTLWKVPPAEKIVRIEGATSGFYLSRLQFFTDKGRSSPSFGQDGGQPFTSRAPRKTALMTISGWADKTKHPAKVRHRAICGVTFHFGAQAPAR